MRIYKKIKRRIAKKHFSKRRWNKLNRGRFLKIGDKIHTCSGEIRNIIAIYPEYGYSKYTQRCIIDFEVLTLNLDGSESYCSFFNCCSIVFI